MIATQYAELEDSDFAAQLDRLLAAIRRGVPLATKDEALAAAARAAGVELCW